MAQDTESRSLDKVIVRLPDGMRDRLKAAAVANKRSMNAEIVARLELSLELEPGESINDIRARVFDDHLGARKDEMSPTEIIEVELQKAIRQVVIATLDRLERDGITSVMIEAPDDEGTPRRMFHKYTRRDEAKYTQQYGDESWRLPGYGRPAPFKSDAEK